MRTKIIGVVAVAFLFLSVKANRSVTDASKASKNSSKLTAAALAELTKNLEYDFDKPAVRDAYYRKLDLLAKSVKEENYAVSLKGHADAIGAYKYNWVLSDQRALNVKKYLVSKGVKESLVITTPFGSTVPIATNATPEGRQKNRRVEISLKKVSDN